jgi:S-DNA-T family DNA segregation ATPase FtsK/SpoIIIE
VARKKAAKGAKGGDKEAPDKAPVLDRELQGELLALALFALALIVLLTLVPVTAMGAGVARVFPAGNAIGPVGGLVAAALWRALGLSAVLVPPLLTLFGLRAGDWLSAEKTLRLVALTAGLILIVPAGAYVLAPATAGPGWLGGALGRPLVAALSWLGTLILLVVLLAGLTVVTLGWRPVRRGGDAVIAGSGVARTGFGALATRFAAWRSGLASAANGTDGVTPLELEPLPPFERETGDPVPAPPVPVAAGAATSAPVAVEAPPRSAPAPRPKKAGPRTERGESAAPAAVEAEPAEKGERRALSTGLPPIELLTEGHAVDRADMEKELDRLGEVLVEKLRTFNVESHVGGRTSGPVVTQFEVVPAPGVKVNRIANLDADLALAMKAQSIRIVAPIPGKGAVGVEIPNPEAAVVQLREIIEAREFRGARGDLPLALGRDLTGKPYVADLAKMPHVLIAGATGSGKSVCINTIITSLVYRHTPETLRLLMIDPKMVELSAYADLPHLRHSVVTDPKDAAGVLKWAVIEMERRYELLSTNRVRSITEFNKKLADGVVLRRVQASGPEGDEDRWIWKDGPLAFIVVVVDELADLMMTVQSEIEKPLAQLAQKARAIGIHLIVATQRPSVNVITGLIKANFPTRIAFRVASKTDSRTILDANGSEALLGNGDMLFLPPGKSEPARIQGAFIATEETERLLGWYRAQRDALAVEAVGPLTRAEADILEEVRETEQLETGDVEEMSGDWDELFRQAAEVCIQHDQGSTSLLQRRLKIGYGRAARIVDQLHEAGVLGPPDGSKPRDVLLSMSELDAMFPGT